MVQHETMIGQVFLPLKRSKYTKVSPEILGKMWKNQWRSMKIWKSNFFYLEKVQNILMLNLDIIEKNSKKQWRNMIIWKILR